MKVNRFAVVLAFMLLITLILSGNEVKASDFGWTKEQGAGALTADPRDFPKATEMSQVERSIDSGALKACKNEQTILDTTLVQRWEKGVPTPPDYNWMDHIGSDIFKTTQMNVIWSGADVLFQIFTNFPESGYQSGSVLYLAADLAFDFERDGVWDEGVALCNHSTIPADTIPPAPPQPPGYGQPADTFVKGNRYSATAWFSANDIHYNHAGYGGLYNEANPKVPYVWMRLGTSLGPAQVTWTNLGGVDPTYRIDVLLQGVNTSGKWDRFNVFWGTANCANDAITGLASKPCRDKVPSMNEWSALLTGLLILGSGIWLLKKRRSA